MSKANRVRKKGVHRIVVIYAKNRLERELSCVAAIAFEVGDCFNYRGVVVPRAIRGAMGCRDEEDAL